MQTADVFTYLVSNIEERLTSVKRDDIDLNDLPEMETMFRLFSGGPSAFASLVSGQSPRWKVLSIAWFRESRHWVINKQWSAEELALLEADSRRPVTKDEFDSLLTGMESASADYQATLMSVDIGSMETKEVALGDEALFRTFIGNRLIKKNIQDRAAPITVYSANVFDPFGWVGTSNVTDFTCPSLIWGIDGNFEVQYIPSVQFFATTDHCGTIQILDPSIVPEYLLYVVGIVGDEARFTRSYRPSLTNMRELKVKIPVRQDGTFDFEAQLEIATAYTTAKSKEKALLEIKQEFDEVFSRYIKAG